MSALIPTNDHPTSSFRRVCGWEPWRNDHHRTRVRHRLKECLRRDLYSWDGLTKRMVGARRAKEGSRVREHRRTVRKLHRDWNYMRRYVANARIAQSNRFKRSAYEPHVFVVRGATNLRVARKRMSAALHFAQPRLLGGTVSPHRHWNGEDQWRLTPREEEAFETVGLTCVFLRAQPSKQQLLVYGLRLKTSTPHDVNVAHNQLTSLMMRCAT